MKKILLFASFLLTSFLAQAQFSYLVGELSGAKQTTPNTSTATGVVIAKYNFVTNVLELHGNYRGLSNTITASSLNEGLAHVDGPVMANITNTGGTSGVLRATVTLTDAQETTLFNAGMYVNVSSAGAYAAGEIRTQLVVTSPNQTDFLEARQQASQEVPPKPSTASGHSFVVLDRGTNKLYLTGYYGNLTAPISGSHIHTGLPGVNGPIMIHLMNSGGTSGTLDVVADVTDDQETSIATGGTYVNVHSTGTYPGGTYAGGEIRGQLTNYSQLTFFAGTLSGANESTPNASPATGTVIVRYDPVSNLLELTGDYQNLSNTISGSHIHGPAPYGANAGVVYSINNTGGTTGTLSLSTTITDAQEAELYSGLWYVNVHSTGTYAAGEIRMQLYYTSAGKSYFLTGMLQGSQEVPSSGSGGTGTVSTLLDAVTGNVYVTGSFSGLGSNAIMAHVHQQRPGQNGGIIFPLSVSPSTSGTVTGSGTLSQEQIIAMIAGSTYVNIHSDLIQSGELRAQLGNLVLPVKLTSFTAFKEREKVALVWTTAQESNLLSYDVEQQDADTKAWLKKGTVAAKGNANGASYRFTDVPKVSKGNTVLYRLRINGNDGKTEYSNVIRVNYQTGKAALTLLSNPVRNGLLRFVVTGLQTNVKAEASVVDYNGRVVLKAPVSLLGNNQIDIGHLGAGMYRLVVAVNDELMQESFVK